MSILRNAEKGTTTGILRIDSASIFSKIPVVDLPHFTPPTMNSVPGARREESKQKD